MKLKHHIIYGGIASLCLFPKFGFLSGIFWAASVLIDVDHYIEFLCRNRFTNFSFKKMSDYCNIILKWNKRPGLLGLSIFHTAEIIGGIYLISIWLNSDVIKAVFWGMVFHMLLDVLYLSKRRILFCRVFSFLEYFIRKKIMIQNGLSPDAIFEEALVVAGVHVTRTQKR
ncbi:MAG: hypothetical protein A2106_06095 [Planctomycetes bacterium GWF2_40_8]|nr:MAG: hypothetical protein A2106_06095 [Planctomycetes bacterium GWF2_40_8]